MHPANRGKSLIRKRTSLCTVIGLRDIPKKASIDSYSFANCSVCDIGYILLQISQQRREDFREGRDLGLGVLQHDGRILCDMRSSNVCECLTCQWRRSR